MVTDVDDVINELALDASNCAIFSETADEIKFHYKLKYPGFYSISTSKITDLLDNQVLFSHLQSSVKSFVYHAREIHKINKGMGSIIASDSTKTDFKSETKSKQNSNVIIKTPETTTTEVDEVFEVPVTSADVTVYDSVHSIKIPWSSCKNVSLKSSKRIFRRKKKVTLQASCGTGQVTGLVFERVEKPLPFPLKNKRVSSNKIQDRREETKSILLTSDDQEIDSVITLDEN